MTVYRPGEDTYLLASVVEEKDLEGLDCLEIGTGSGFIAEKMLENGAETVTAVDINPEAVEEASQRLPDSDNVEVFHSDMFQEVEERYDLIVFNPPYLPSEASRIGDEEIWAGGEKGIEASVKFVEKAESYLKDDGEVFFVASSLSELEVFDDLEVVDSRRLWFEEIFVLKFK